MMAMMEHPDGFTDGNGTFWPGCGAANYDGTTRSMSHLPPSTTSCRSPDDPEYVFGVTRPVNNREANIHGWEFGGQYFFGETGFGVLANYTVVRGDVGFDNASDPEREPIRAAGV